MSAPPGFPWGKLLMWAFIIGAIALLAVMIYANAQSVT